MDTYDRRASFNEENPNTCGNPSFETVLQARFSRRNLGLGSVGGAATALLGTLGLTACGGSDDPAPAPSQPTERLLGFEAVGKSLADAVVVPAGYTARVLYALGDPLDAATPAFANDGTDGDFERRAGDHHDGMEWFGLAVDGTPSASAQERGLLAVNHEATTDERLSSFVLHADGGASTLPRPAAEADKEMAVHGISVVEVRRGAGTWLCAKDSPFNRRLTCLTDIEISGPARGSPLLVTRYSPDGTRTRGTLNKCGTGKTPWDTFLTGEENWFGISRAALPTMQPASTEASRHCGATGALRARPHATAGRPRAARTDSRAGTSASWERPWTAATITEIS